MALLVSGATGVRPAHAAAIQSNFNLGISMFQQPDSGLISQGGYFLHFQVQPRDRWIRPTYGAHVEASFGANRLLNGSMMGGAELVALTAVYIKPFLGAQGLFGMANLDKDSNTYLGLIFGAILTTGAEIRLTDKEKSTALRITSFFRFCSGTVGGGVKGSDLNTLGIGMGFTF